MASKAFSLAKIIRTGVNVNGGSTSTNIPDSLVLRDASGNFSAGTITSALSGNATTATTLATSRNIAISGDVTGSATSFNGSSDITISAGITSGSIVNADINASASIADTKLATIATAGKVSNSATTATSSNTAAAIVSRDASGNFSAGTITAALSGNASTATTAGTVTTAAQPNITSVGTLTSLTSSGIVSGSELTSTNATGDEGGQINLAKPPNATISGGVTIDVYQDKIRFFEKDGTSRGVFIDLTGASASVGTNLLAGGVGDGTLTSAKFSSATSLIIYNSAGTALKTIYSPGS